MDEISRLPAVSIDDGRLTLVHILYKYRDNARIRRSGILAKAENVTVPLYPNEHPIRRRIGQQYVFSR
jgi:hypothetical protein